MNLVNTGSTTLNQSPECSINPVQQRLLIVDDELHIGRALTRILRNNGYEIEVATSPQSGHEVLAAKHVDVVISDYKMPGTNGVEFLAEVRAKHPHTVRLMLSGQADMEAVIQALNTGSIFKFLVKPWQNDAIREVVSDAFALADSQRDRRDPDSGWLSRATFLSQPVSPATTSASVVVGGWMDIVRTLNAVDERHRNSLYRSVTERVQQSLDVMRDLAMVERGTFACLVQGEVPQPLLAQGAHSLGAPVAVGDTEVRSTFRMAVAPVEGETNATNLEQALRHSLAALDIAEPTSAVEYTPALGLQLHTRRTLERDLHHALARQEIFYELQPQFCVESKRIVSAEALLRWRHPRLGLISPLHVVEMAEKNGLIDQIGEWIAYAGCRQLVEWREQGREDLRLSINISPRQFLSSDIVQLVRSLVSMHDLKPGSFELEITESCVMEDPDDAAARLLALKELGVRVALDDFGTGYSSLAQINKLPIDVLKIDRCFVQNIEGPFGDDYQLLGQVVQMANSLGLETVAEGVETDAQFSACADFGCSLIQGYLISRPISPADFHALTAGG